MFSISYNIYKIKQKKILRDLSKEICLIKIKNAQYKLTFIYLAKI